ncbi:PaaI family thioesterase [Erythrobacter sp.]|uniref:PaaI family thioesterase n=1 Tax=Erythrobacter sp. TaxID=1042 RepID=UPI0025C3FECA|nr:PaaI family thioesterase [Erythrobacter sp.]
MTDFAKSMPLAELLGIEIAVASSEHVTGNIEVRPDLCTAGETVHGGTLMAFADSLGAIGAYLALPEGANGTTTIESKTSFVGRAVPGDRLTGDARPISIGKRISVWQTRIETGDHRLIALVTQTQLVL